MIAQLLAVALDVNIAAGAVDDRFLCCPAEAGEWKPKTLLFVPATSVALNGTNYMTVTVYGADGTTAIASFNTNTGGTALTAGTPVSLSLTAGLNLEFGLSRPPQLETLTVSVYENEDNDSLIGTLERNVDYTYDIEANAVVFTVEQAPPPSTFIVVRYEILPSGANVGDPLEEPAPPTDPEEIP